MRRGAFALIVRRSAGNNGCLNREGEARPNVGGSRRAAPMLGTRRQGLARPVERIVRRYGDECDASMNLGTTVARHAAECLLSTSRSTRPRGLHPSDALDHVVPKLPTLETVRLRQTFSPKATRIQ